MATGSNTFLISAQRSPNHEPINLKAVLINSYAVLNLVENQLTTGSNTLLISVQRSPNHEPINSKADLTFSYASVKVVSKKSTAGAKNSFIFFHILPSVSCVLSEKVLNGSSDFSAFSLI